MGYHPFPALLISSYNSVHEYGLATPGPSGCVDFTSDFVPLLPLGAQATIQWVIGEKTIEAYRGNVYLSSPQLVRLVDVEESKLANVRNIFEVNTSINASVAMKEKFQTKNSFSAEIIFLSTKTIKLRINEFIGEGAQIILEAEAPFLTLHNLKLNVVQRIVLRRGEALLICEPVSVSDENLIVLSTYSARLEAANASGKTSLVAD